VDILINVLNRHIGEIKKQKRLSDILAVGQASLAILVFVVVLQNILCSQNHGQN